MNWYTQCGAPRNWKDIFVSFAISRNLRYAEQRDKKGLAELAQLRKGSSGLCVSGSRKENIC